MLFSSEQQFPLPSPAAPPVPLVLLSVQQSLLSQQNLFLQDHCLRKALALLSWLCLLLSDSAAGEIGAFWEGMDPSASPYFVFQRSESLSS